jgi:pyridoxamine 5'-phosphate oxidase
MTAQYPRAAASLCRAAARRRSLAVDADTVASVFPPDPIDAFAAVFARAGSAAPPPPADHTAAALATSDMTGRPSVRMVLVRRFDADGFLFFTNYESRKAGDLETNPHAALCFYWYWIEQQVRVEGSIARATAAESDDYFASRPRGSQLGAWASRQSHVLPSRAELETRYRAVEDQYEGRPVPRPPFWGGMRLIPERLEFWSSGSFRLHERLVYMRDGAHWKAELLYP